MCCNLCLRISVSKAWILLMSYLLFYSFVDVMKILFHKQAFDKSINLKGLFTRTIKVTVCVSVTLNITSYDRPFDCPISAQTFNHNAIMFIDTSNNVWYNQAHWLFGMPYLSIIASDDLHCVNGDEPFHREWDLYPFCLLNGLFPLTQW